MSDITIGYWSCKGSAEYPKWVASYLGLKFTEKTHEMDEWFEKNEKFSIGLDFPNLPYLIDGDFKMCESKAMPYYFAAKVSNTDIVGGDLFGQAKVRQIIDVLDDIDRALQSPFYDSSEDIPSKVKKVISGGKAISKIAQLSSYLGDRKFFIGNTPTLADFYFAVLMRYYSILIRSSGNECPFRKHVNLVQHMQMVTSLPAIAKWLSEDKKCLVPSFFFPFELLEE